MDDSDEPEYDSSEDEDYVPEGDIPASDESESENKAGVKRKRRGKTPSPKKTTSPKKRKPSAKKRKLPVKRHSQRRTGAGGIRLEKDEDSLSEEEHIEDDIEEEPEEDDDEEMKKLEKRVAKEEERKKRVDDLWASFKEDTASVRPKRSSVSEKVSDGKHDEPKVDKDTKPEEQNKTAEQSPKKEEKSESKKISVTQTFEFAGEEVKVTKELDADSEEAKKIKEQEESKSGQDSSKQKPGYVPGASGAKRAGGLGSVLGSLGKKTKISTLEKTKLDWEKFKKEEGLEDELRTKARAGYLDRQEFLQRADYRQWENERELRLATSKFKK